MAVSIGKRKRQEDEDDKKGDSGDEDAMRALFQRAFEAKFKPLERTVVTFPEPQNEAEFDEADNSDGTDSDWSGLSGDQDPLETIQYSVSHADNLDVQRNERRAFMVRVRLNSVTVRYLLRNVRSLQGHQFRRRIQLLRQSSKRKHRKMMLQSWPTKSTT